MDFARGLAISNSVYISAVVVAAVATLFVSFFGSRLARQKDDELATFQNESNLKISSAQAEAAKANERAGLANERAARLEVDAEKLRLEAEKERLARVKIEEKIAPRRLTAEQIRSIANRLREFSGQRLNTFVVGGDSEIVDIGDNILSALIGERGAGWIVTVSTGQDSRVMDSGIIVEFSPGADSRNLVAAQSLADALRSERLDVIGPRQSQGGGGAFMGNLRTDPGARIRLVISKKP
jgi:hypothetical protein